MVRHSPETIRGTIGKPRDHLSPHLDHRREAASCAYSQPRSRFQQQRREAIWRDHVDYTKGFLYFPANDPRVPPSLQKEANQWGLAKGEFVVTQRDLQTDLTKPDPIGMGSYNSDSHNMQRIAAPDGFVRNEGDMQVPVTPYQISFRVPVCSSGSHVAYSSLRMEPQYMIMGQAAGLAAKMTADAGLALQDVNTAALTARLKEQGAVFEYVPSPQRRQLDALRKTATKRP